MNTRITTKNCVGCLACINICPRKAISQDSKKAFIQPVVNEKSCIECGLCVKVCPQNINLYENSFLQQAYSVKHFSDEVLSKSTSGGAFSAFAEHTIKENGVVYGCETVGKRVFHNRTETDYSNMRGSKYVQSDLEKVYESVKNDLLQRKSVLFTGTPCQCAAMAEFLKIQKVSTEKLLLVDFVCHGITSPQLFSDYISYCEKKTKENIEMHLFRSKIKGWTKHVEMNCLTDGKVDFQSYESQLYKAVFHSRLGMNEACFNCRFTSVKRVSDITMADFWGVQKTHPDLFDSKGVSFVLINSSKGKTFFEKCDGIEKQLVSVEDTEQPSLYKPAQKPIKYDVFWHDYDKKGFRYIVKKYYNGSKLYRVFADIYHKLFKR